MIGVIADDLTGAAEVGAVGLRHGLQAEVVLAGEPSREADLLCLDTDSRACAPGEAAERATRAARLLRQRRAGWLYKKTDSVLRGNVTPEIEAIVAALGLDGALLVPANPSLGRKIVDGQYSVRGQWLHETEFAHDPRHPRSSPSVRELIAEPASLPLFVRRAEEGLPARGIVIGDAASPKDLRQWAALRNDRWLMAGGAEFFSAILALPVSSALPKPAQGRELFVCGSATRVTRDFVARQTALGVRVFSLPQELATTSSVSPAQWALLGDEVVAALHGTERAVLHVGLPPVHDVAIAEGLALHLVRVAQHVIPLGKTRHVFAEGGATAVALARQMRWHRLQVTAELGPGIVTLSTHDASATRFTIKPGSYPWPEGTAAWRPR
ncbi:MAG TPA: four-carbon acid sugar kinase family protein [Verrucomicrobiota bacterium]|nr:four-carbon acid sugar kinase family protein [Verrucomicrobiota bacterium]